MVANHRTEKVFETEARNVVWFDLVGQPGQLPQVGIAMLPEVLQAAPEQEQPRHHTRAHSAIGSWCSGARLMLITMSGHRRAWPTSVPIMMVAIVVHGPHPLDGLREAHQERQASRTVPSHALEGGPQLRVIGLVVHSLTWRWRCTSRLLLVAAFTTSCSVFFIHVQPKKRQFFSNYEIIL